MSIQMIKKLEHIMVQYVLITQETNKNNHVIQTVPPNCVNRDDTGSLKTAINRCSYLYGYYIICGYECQV